MPQMSPLWWEILFIFFIYLFIIMNTIIFYNKMPNMSTSLSKKQVFHQFKWKW
nr:ATPase subunit 8 [Hydarella orientalis]